MLVSDAAGRAKARLLSRARTLLPGIAFSLALALAATFLARHYGAPAMLLTLLLGMAFSFASRDARFEAGVGFAAKSVLRFGVALLGARITFDQIAGLGWEIMAGIALAVGSTIGFGVLGARLLGLKLRFGVLSAGATAICGASAAAAISAVLPRYGQQERDTAFTIIGVTALSTVAMVLYPILARAFGWSDIDIGIFLGGSIHDVAQVMGAGYSVSAEAGDAAAIIKLLRVSLLVPVVLFVSLGARRIAAEGAGPKQPSLIPGFLVAFLALVVANSLGFVPETLGAAMTAVSGWCILTAIAALGIRTSFGAMLSVGHRAIGLIVAETLFIAAAVTGLLLLIAES